MNSIPESHRDLLSESKRAFAMLATIMDDGSPQVTPVWFDVQGDHLRINSAQGRQKDLNMRRQPEVALAIMDPQNPYRYMQIRGRVVEVTGEGADAHIDALSAKYTGNPQYQSRSSDEVRVTYIIQPERVTVMG